MITKIPSINKSPYYYVALPAFTSVVNNTLGFCSSGRVDTLAGSYKKNII